MALKKKSILLVMAFLIGCFVCACGKEDSVVGESLVEDTEEVSSTEETKNTEEEAAVQWEKGYDLPVDEQEREEAETDCKKLMEHYLDIYETADKGIASNVVLDDQTVLEMQKKVKDAGYPIATMVTYSNMGNYESVDSFLKECMEGKRGSVVIYEIHNDGGLGRMKFIFDGTDMYVVSTRGIWNADNEQGISYISYTRLKEWKYTEKGWFCYELCVPEPPEVSEIADGSCLIRIKPMTEGGFYYWHEWAVCLGPNGNKITFEKTGLYEAKDCLARKAEILFWLKAEEYFQRNPNAKYKSIGVCDAFWLDYQNGTYGNGSFDDGKTDLSAALLCPYLCMDGMNEMGLCVSIMALSVKGKWEEIPFDTYKDKLKYGVQPYVLENPGEEPLEDYIYMANDAIAINIITKNTDRGGYVSFEVVQ